MQTSNNKETAVSFVSLIVSGKIDESYEKYTSKNFYHHNQYFPGDRDSLMKAMKDNHRQFPNKILDVKLVLQDGDFVSVLFHVKREPQDRGIAVSVILRFENEKIAELWDISQEIIENSPNNNGIY
jgi:predicted SnoaL-like aldol condensation-catalyzing enzyme